ncbi:MAG: hypothetical protein AAGJ40_02885 [Planctomycetota bacterium]
MFQVEGCPSQFCNEVVYATELIDLFQKGCMPVAGGTLDQAAWFTEAARIFSTEEVLAKSIGHDQKER